MASRIADQESAPKMKPYQWGGLFVVYLLIPLVLWVFGWDVDWWQAWVYSAIIFIAGVGGRAWAERIHPGLQAERVKFEKAPGVKSWDKILGPLTALSVGFPLYIVAGLDHRFGWTPAFPLWINLMGLLFCALGYGFAMWALAVNRFFSSAVRIQTERGHVVCDSGPYRYVRHPGYAGNLLPLVGIALALSSLWTLIPAVVAMIIVVIRTELEDQTLKEELPGYRDYSERVHYRLIPWIY